MRNGAWLLVLTLGCGSAVQAERAPAGLAWDAAFEDGSGERPVHFVATYVDARGTHRLEEWRVGTAHLRRRTDDRIDLHADATAVPRAGQPVDYVWQVIDVQRHIDNRIGSQAMLHAGLFYSFYAMAHVVARPAGRVEIVAAPASTTARVGGPACTWFELRPDGQAASRVCWSRALGLAVEMQTHRPDGSWATEFALQTVDRAAIPASVFAVDTAGLEVRNHDAMVDDD